MKTDPPDVRRSFDDGDSGDGGGGGTTMIQ